MNMTYTNTCKYQLPCGWCELRKMMCPNNQQWTITPTWQSTTTNPMDVTTTYTKGVIDGGEE